MLLTLHYSELALPTPVKLKPQKEQAKGLQAQSRKVSAIVRSAVNSLGLVSKTVFKKKKIIDKSKKKPQPKVGRRRWS